MANQEQNPPQQEQPFVAAKQVGFNLEDILLNTNNKYSTKDLENSKVFFSIPTGGIFGEVGVNTFRNAIGAHYLPYSSEYVVAPFIDVVRQWFSTIGYREEVSAKGTLKKSLLPPRWSKEATKGRPSKAPTGSKFGHSKKRKESSSAMDSNPSQPLVSTPVDTRMHKEDHQETASFIIHSESASRNDASAASITEAGPGNSAPSDFVPQQHGINEGTKTTSYDNLFAVTDPHVLVNQTKSISEGLETVLAQPITGKGASSDASQIVEETSSTIKLEDLAKLVSRVQPSFKDLDSPEDDPVIVVNDSDEDEDDEVHATENSQKNKLELEKNKDEAKAALLKAQPSFPNVEHLKELPDLPSKFNNLTEEAKGLKNQVHNMEIKLLGELKEIPPKLEGFTKTVTSGKLKTLGALLSLLNKLTNSLNQFAQAITSKKTGVHQKAPLKLRGSISRKTKEKKALSSEEAVKESTESDYVDDKTHLSGSMKIEEEAKAKAAKHESEVRKEELIDLLGPEPVICTLANGEVMKACPNRTGKRWETIYKQIGTRMHYIYTIEAELGINLDIPLRKQDTFNKLNDLANKKIKYVDDIHDYFKANKRLKSSVQYEHLPSTVLNEPVLASSTVALQVLRRLGSIFTSVYAAKLKRVVSLLEGTNNLKYEASAKNNEDAFDNLLSRVEISEDNAISLFVGGLPTEIKIRVRMFNPRTLVDAYCLINLQEATLNVVKKKNRMVYNGGSSTSTRFNAQDTTLCKPLLPLPQDSSVQTPKTNRKQLTQREYQEKKANNLCFYYNQKYTPSHKCSGQMYSLEVLAIEDDETQDTGMECLGEENFKEIEEMP
ncbi:hypothetical protein Tco_1028332 [Tanacetum coccineum]|uniref:Uncharacterized protein n=1 Tax=Tanacetum coccineum TaxID=301880 RepID=A0ABQ5G096_9ASTR